jgi:hypothetical protein
LVTFTDCIADDQWSIRLIRIAGLIDAFNASPDAKYFDLLMGFVVVYASTFE